MTAQRTALDVGNIEGGNDQVGAGSRSTLVDTTHARPVPTPCIDGYAVIVSTERGARRRLYLSLHSASKAAERSRDRGHDVELVLVRLVPVEGGGPL